MTLTPEQLQALYAYAGAGVPTSSVLRPQQPAAITMPVVEMGPTPPMPVVAPPPGASAPMPVYSPPVAANPDAAALSAQLGLAPPAPAPPQAPSSPVSPLAQGLQLPAGIAPPGTTPAVMAPTSPPVPAPAPVPAPPPPPVAAPPAPPRHVGGPAGGPAPAAPQGPSWTQRRRADEQDYLSSFGAERAALQRANDAGAVVRDEDAQAEARIARQKEEYAANEAAFQRDEAAARDAFRAQTQKQIDEVRNATIDPGRLYRDSGALTGVMVGIGGALAGMSAALNKTDPDAFAKVIQRHIDRDVDAQVRGLAQKNAGIADRNTMYAQLITDNRDAVLSRAQTTAAMLESARGMAAAEAKRLGTPEAQARLEALDAQLARQQAQAKAAVDGAEEQAAARAAQALANARAAAAAAAAAREEKMFQRGVTLEKLRLEGKKIDVDAADKPGLAGRFVATGQDPVTKQPTGYIARDTASAKEEQEGITSAQEAIAAARRILAERTAQGTWGRATSRGAGNPLGAAPWVTKVAVDHGILLAKANKAMKMGTMDAGTAPILEAVAGKGAADTDLIGDETNDRLREFIAINERFLEIGRQHAAGLQAVKAADASGREVVIPTGKQAAPANEREVKRTPIR